ncbi:guanine nucleotide exchange factor DBS isoform X4 [Mauremys reevesii]|uniref:guanine nucleotide exchange factor DBS isoform X4 n=1 Tax=Mauremys reevesii TaxID=260615 RepID=UPI00193F5CF1|nr:guanine nucleotide exchange factor DBS isoform X4 [Mauremys reevesii]
MSVYWHWRVILCKETGSCNCFVTESQSNEEKEEDIEPQIVVSDIIQLVREKQQVPAMHAEEIMHQDIIPLCAADIEDQLKKQFAYLSGGRGEDGCPVITFPDYPAFSEIPEKEFQNVLTYLTSIPRRSSLCIHEFVGTVRQRRASLERWEILLPLSSRTAAQANLQDAGIGFILVIDRRQDKWTSVKASILRIAASFPGNLQLVLVLRPTGFIHRTLSDLAFKFNRDEFKMKVPIIMLGSVTELHGYIDKTQLTEDLGGTLDYCHNRWLSHRTAIESFALMVKQTAQMLQSFGTELAETELPNDVQSTSSLLAAHSEKKDKMKEDLRLALKQGHDILESNRKPVAENPDYKLNQDQLDNQTTVERLLAQLDETEIAFDEFWAKHQQKLEQCVQLRNFEQTFREVKAALSIASERLSAFTDVGNSVSHVEHILKDLANFEEKSRESLGKARVLASQGDQLVQNNHYAVDSILPKCNELHHLCDAFATETEKRRGLLNKSLELHSLLEKSMRWCDEGIYLLASQPVDKCQSQDGAESALQEIEKFLDTGADNKIKEPNKVYQLYEPVFNQDLMEHVQKVFQKQESMEEMFQKRQVSLKKLAAKQTRPVQPVAPRPEVFVKSPCVSPGLRRGSDYVSNTEDNMLRRMNYRRLKNEMSEIRQSRGGSVMDDEENLAVLRSHVINELIETERAYVEELLCVLEGYASEMDNPLMMHLISPGLLNKKDILFGNMEEIYHFHNRIFLKELENYIEYPELVGRCFLERMEDFQIYEKYCQNKPRSESLWRQFSDSAFFQECQRKLDHKLSLDSYLLKPVQRITKYQLLLKEMLKYSKNCEGAEDLQEALTSILGILKAVNDSMHQIAITGYDGNLNELGKLLMQGSFNVWTDHKKGHSKVKDLARFKPMQRHLFLHEKAVLFCKKREENGEGYEKAPSYSYKHSLNMTAVGITENAKGDSKKFEIWYNAREEVYIIQAPTPEIKATWVNEIRKVLTSQLQACREASQHRTLEQTHSLSIPAPTCTSPSRNQGRTVKKVEERKTDPTSPEGCVTSVAPKYPEKGKDDTVISSTSECSALSKKRFTLQGFTNLKSQKASPTSPDKKAKRHEVKSDPTPFGLRDASSVLTLDRAKWLSTSNLLPAAQRRQGWAKTSHSLDASEENDGWSSAEDPLNSSDAEEEEGEDGGEIKLTPGKYTVVTDYDKKGSEDLAVKSGDLVQLIREGDGEDRIWYVKNLSTGKEGLVPANNLLMLIGNSKSAQSLSSSESGTGCSTLSSSSSYNESCNAGSTSF